MAEILNLDDFRPSCEHCIYHKRDGICGITGGWEWDKHFSRCVSFVRKKDGINPEKT